MKQRGADGRVSGCSSHPTGLTAGNQQDGKEGGGCALTHHTLSGFTCPSVSSQRVPPFAPQDEPQSRQLEMSEPSEGGHEGRSERQGETRLSSEQLHPPDAEKASTISSSGSSRGKPMNIPVSVGVVDGPTPGRARGIIYPPQAAQVQG